MTVATPLVDWTVTVVILVTISTIAISLRILAINVRKVGLKIPDYLLFISYTCQIGYLIDVCYYGFSHGGYGEHIATLTLDKIISSLKGFWISEWFWAPGVASFRLSILLLYMDIFKVAAFRRAAIVIGTVVFLYLISCFLAIALLCHPIEFNWDITIEDGKCGNGRVIEIFSAVFNMAIDLMVVFLPLPVIWSLQLSQSKKWAVTVSFSLGMCTAGVNLGRLIRTIQCPTSSDMSFCILDSSILVMAELTSGILVASVPTLGPLLRGRANKSTYENDTPEQRGGIRTIGSIPLRRPRGKTSTLDDSLFSRNATQAYEELEESTAGLAKTGANMGHQAEVGRGQSRDGSVGADNAGNGIVRKAEYKVSEWRGD